MRAAEPGICRDLIVLSNRADEQEGIGMSMARILCTDELLRSLAKASNVNRYRALLVRAQRADSHLHLLITL
jgi:hypothetical protein